MRRLPRDLAEDAVFQAALWVAGAICVCVVVGVPTLLGWLIAGDDGALIGFIAGGVILLLLSALLAAVSAMVGAALWTVILGFVALFGGAFAIRWLLGRAER